MGRLLRIVWRWTLLLVLLVAVAAGGEDLVLRFRLNRGADRAVVDQVTTYEAAANKDGRLEIYFDQPQIQECVHALFPHFGDPPCWYVRRHQIKLLSQSIRSVAPAACPETSGVPRRPPDGTCGRDGLLPGAVSGPTLGGVRSPAPGNLACGYPA